MFSSKSRDTNEHFNGERVGEEDTCVRNELWDALCGVPSYA